MKIFVYYIGKPREECFNRLAEEYIKRSSRYGHCEMREIHPQRFDPWAKHPSASKILLDPGGKALDSEKFSKLLEKAELEARDLVMLVGGATGFPADWLNREGTKLSLSPLTFPHELARVLITEQIYRAFTMLRGHPYPK